MARDFEGELKELSMTPLGTKAIGELAITGMAAAIANAVLSRDRHAGSLVADLY